MPLSDLPSNSTTATRVCARLRYAILSGELIPGQKLGIDAMRKRFEAGATPVREALNRLMAEGLVAFRDLRGFDVVDFGEQELVELFRTRVLRIYHPRGSHQRRRRMGRKGARRFSSSRKNPMVDKHGALRSQSRLRQMLTRIL
jgi:hypothetical protein